VFRGGIAPATVQLLGVALAVASLAPVAVQAQVKAPRYEGGLNAPVQQLQLPPLPPAITKGGTVVEDVVVRVNDQIISRSDVERANQQMVQEAQQAKAPPAEIADAQKNLLRDMIDQQLLLSRAKELGLNADADVIRRLDEVRKENKLASMEELERVAKQQGVNFEDYKAKIRDQILTQQVVRDEVGRKLQMTRADEEKFYEAHKDAFQQPEQVHLSEILVPVAEDATPAELVQAQKKADALEAQIKGGADFAELAKKNSGGPTAAQGGDLGLFERGKMASVFDEQTFAMKPGQTTQPIRTKQGFVILKVTEHLQAGPKPLSAVEPQIQDALYSQQMGPRLRQYLTGLREAAYIDVAPGFVDSGASPKETKPIFTAYAPPAVKKKKEKKVVRFERGGKTTLVAAAAPKTSSAPVIASPDTTGSRTLTGAEAAPLVDPKTGLAQIPGVNTGSSTVASNKKFKRLKKEKIRFGQAPRSTLGNDQGETTQTAAVAPAAGNPGTPSVLTGSSLAAANGVAEPETPNAENPLAPVAAPKTKTRFAAKAAEVKKQKKLTLTAKQREKILAKPEAATPEELAAAKEQAAPLGLGGDTAPKKTKKPKKVKGAPKVRLEGKPAETKPAPAPIEPTASPALAPADNLPPSSKTPPPATPPPSL
jgi:peptidyl-prolyl cis-trans isomerase SurA